MNVSQKKLYTLIGCSFAIFWCGAFIFGFPGVMGPYWRSHFNVGRGAIGHTMFFVLASTGMLMFFVGRIQERLGARLMITIGALICGLDVIFISFTPNIMGIYVWAFLMGTSSCFLLIPGLTTLQRWFPARRGLVAGILNCSFGLSAALMSPVFSYLLGSIGYTYMTIGLGLVALVVGVIAAQYTSLPSQSEERAIQASMPLGSPAQPEFSLTVSESIRTKSFWLLWLVWALQGGAAIAMVTLSTQYGLSKGWNLVSAVSILTAFNITNGLSRLITGYLSDIIGRNLTMSIAFVSAGLAYLVLPYASGLMAVAVLAALVGCAWGTMFAVSAPLAVDCFGLIHFGAIFGMVFTAYGFAAGPLGPSLSGYILDVTNGNFHTVFTYLGAFCLISGVLIQFVRPPSRR